MIEGFVYDERLDIHVPMLERPFDEYELDKRLAMIAYWGKSAVEFLRK
jgi:hypothetical protein